MAGEKRDGNCSGRNRRSADPILSGASAVMTGHNEPRRFAATGVTLKRRTRGDGVQGDHVGWIGAAEPPLAGVEKLPADVGDALSSAQWRVFVEPWTRMSEHKTIARRFSGWFRKRSFIKGQGKVEGGALSGAAFHPHAASVSLDNALGNAQPQAGAPFAACR